MPDEVGPVEPAAGPDGPSTGSPADTAAQRRLDDDAQVVSIMRLLVAADVVLLACHLAVLLYFIIGITRIGPQDPLVGFNGARYPRDLIPFRDHAANPFAWLYHTLAWTFRSGPALLGALLVASLAGFWRGRTIDPAVTRQLLFAATGIIVGLIIALSPLGSEIRLWLLY